MYTINYIPTSNEKIGSLSMEGTSSRNDVYEELKQYSSRPKRDVPVKPISRNARYEHFIRTGTTPESRVTREFNDISVKYAHNKNIFDLMRHSTRPPNIPDLPIPDPMVMFEIQKNNKDIRKQKTTSNITDFLLKFAASVLQYDDYNDRSVPMDKRTQDMLFQNNFKKAIGSKDIIDILKRSENNFNQYSDLFIRLASSFSPQILGRDVSNIIKKQPISDNLSSWLSQVFSKTTQQAPRPSERTPFVPRYGTSTSTMYEMPPKEEEKEEEEEEESAATVPSWLYSGDLEARQRFTNPPSVTPTELVSQQRFMREGNIEPGLNIPESIYRYIDIFMKTNESEIQEITAKIVDSNANYDDTVIFDQLQIINNILVSIANEYQAGRSPLDLLHNIRNDLTKQRQNALKYKQNKGAIKNAEVLGGVIDNVSLLIKDIGEMEWDMSPRSNPANVVTYAKNDGPHEDTEEQEFQSQLIDPIVHSQLPQEQFDATEYKEVDEPEPSEVISQPPQPPQQHQQPQLQKSFENQLIYELLTDIQTPTNIDKVPPPIMDYLKKFSESVQRSLTGTDILSLSKKKIINNTVNNIINMYNRGIMVVPKLLKIYKSINANIQEYRREKMTPETSLDMKLLMGINSYIGQLQGAIEKEERNIEMEKLEIAEELRKKEQSEKKVMELINPVVVPPDKPLPEMAPASSSMVPASSLTTTAPIRSYVKEYPEESVYEPEIRISNSAVLNAAKEMQMSDEQASRILSNLHKSGLTIKGTKREDIPGSVADWLSNIRDPSFTIGDLELEFVSNILFNSLHNISDIENIPEQKKKYGAMRSESLTGLLRNFTVLSIYWTIQAMMAGDNKEAAKEFALNARKFQMERQKMINDNEVRQQLTTSQITRYNAFFEKGYGKRKPITRRRRY